MPGGKNSRPRPERLLPLLREEQRTRGHISPEALLRIASETGVAPSVAYGVATFYHELRPGSEREMVVRVCDSPSCHLAGSEDLVALLEQLAPGRFTVERVGCLGQCDRAPAVILNGRLHVRVRPRELPLLLSRLEAEGGTGDGDA